MTTLEEQEARISKSFVEIGDALRIIRDSRLYKPGWTSFEAYCQEKWGWKKSYAHMLIQAASVAQEMSTIVDDKPVSNEGQARELAKVPQEDRAEVWEEAWQATGGKPTAKAVREAYEVRRGLVPDDFSEDAWFKQQADTVEPCWRAAEALKESIPRLRDGSENWSYEDVLDRVAEIEEYLSEIKSILAEKMQPERKLRIV